MSRRLVLGVDPGKGGAAALLGYEDTSFSLIDVTSFEMIGDRIDTLVLKRWFINELDGEELALAVIEQVSAMPTDSRSGAFAFGRNLGAVEGMLRALPVPIVHITPAQWKRDLRMPVGDKDGARQWCMDRWPMESAFLTKGRGQAYGDAICIGLAGARREWS